MAPLRREWAALKSELAAAFKKGKGAKADRDRLAAFQKKLSTMTVLDPACGSGNFLYVSLRRLLDLEKEVVTFATQLGFSLKPQVSVQQLKAIEINPYAFELAQVSVQVGYLQWRRDNGFDNDRSPVLQNLDGFQNEDALLVPHFRNKAKTLKEAQAGEHVTDDALKFYTEREWPKCEVIVGNPPFLGNRMMAGELGKGYVAELFSIFGERLGGKPDLCCYWFEKARELIEHGKCKRAGLLATQGIRGGTNRNVLKNILKCGGIFFAESDRPWTLDGANVHVSLVGFDNGTQTEQRLDGNTVQRINANLTAASDTTQAQALFANSSIGFQGAIKRGPFDLENEMAITLMKAVGNPNGRPNSDVLYPYINASDLTSGTRNTWIIDFKRLPENSAAQFAKAFEHVEKHVKQERERTGEKDAVKTWWIHWRTRPEMSELLEPLPRFLATPCVSKHRFFVWLTPPTYPDHAVIAFARADDYFFGVLQSRFHEVWALKQGTRLETRPRYTPSTCFETFPFPHPTPAQESTIAAAAKELNSLREGWLNPPEWTETRTLTFPGSMGGPWARYIDPATVNAKTGVGTVRYPRLEPKDADCAAKLKKHTLTNLYNERPAWLDLAHRKLDAAVAAAYGWPADLSDEQILERLLALNLERAAEEAKAAKVKQPKTQREKQTDELI